MGISGACRCCEITNLTVDDITDKGSYLMVKIPDTKTNTPRSFSVLNEGFSVNAVELFRKYQALRPAAVPIRRFFLNYRHNKCTVQPVGINSISKIPQIVAKYLSLPHSDQYTGHSKRRSSATLLANAGADITTVKRHGGWKSTTVAEGYIEELEMNKIQIARKINRGYPETITSSILTVHHARETENVTANPTVLTVPNSSHQEVIPHSSTTIPCGEIQINSTTNNESKNSKSVSFTFNINLNLK